MSPARQHTPDGDITADVTGIYSTDVSIFSHGKCKGPGEGGGGGGNTPGNIGARRCVSLEKAFELTPEKEVGRNWRDRIGTFKAHLQWDWQ